MHLCLVQVFSTEAYVEEPPLRWSYEANVSLHITHTHSDRQTVLIDRPGWPDLAFPTWGGMQEKMRASFL